MIVTEDYLKIKGFDVYKQDEPNHFEKYLYRHNVKIGYDKYDDENIYHTELVVIYKRYSYDDDRNPIFTYDIYIDVTTPGIYNGRLEFKQKFKANEELTAEYLEGLMTLFNIH